MKKLALQKIREAKKENQANAKNDLLKDITSHLQQIGFKVMGVFASDDDDKDFLELYAKLAAFKANIGRSNLVNAQSLARADIDISSLGLKTNPNTSFFRLHNLPNEE